MTWLYIPPGALPEPKTHASSASPSAPEQAGSTLGSPLPSPDIELWAMSNGKPTPQPLSWRGWKMRPWIRLLYGTKGLDSPTGGLRGGGHRLPAGLRSPRGIHPARPVRSLKSRSFQGVVAGCWTPVASQKIGPVAGDILRHARQHTFRPGKEP